MFCIVLAYTDIDLNCFRQQVLDNCFHEIILKTWPFRSQNTNDTEISLCSTPSTSRGEWRVSGVPSTSFVSGHSIQRRDCSSQPFLPFLNFLSTLKSHSPFSLTYFLHHWLLSLCYTLYLHDYLVSIQLYFFLYLCPLSLSPHLSHLVALKIFSICMSLFLF